MQQNDTQSAKPRSFNLALFFAGCLWVLAASSAAAHSAQGIATRFNLPVAAGALEQSFFLFLLVCGFSTIRWMSTRTGGIRATNALPTRATAGKEWLRGAALGWGMLLVAVLPMMLGRTLFPQLWLAPSAWGLALVSLLTLALYTLALEVAFRGFIFTRLIAAIGPVAATIVLSLIYAIASSYRPYSTPLSAAVAFFAGVLFSMAYLRTHALWLGWGMHFAWDASMAVLLGLPVAGYGTYSSVVENGHGWSRLAYRRSLRPRRRSADHCRSAWSDDCSASYLARLRLELHASADRSGRLRRGHCATRRAHRHGSRSRARTTGADSQLYADSFVDDAHHRRAPPCRE